MRVFWDHAPNEGGEIWIRPSLAERMYYLTDLRKEHPCPHCGRMIWPTKPGRLRWLQHKNGDMFFPRMMVLPPEDKPLCDRPNWSHDLRRFLIRAVGILPKSGRHFRCTPTSAPQGVLYIWWRMVDVPAGHHKLPEGRYLDISPYFVPGRGMISAADWKTRQDIPTGFPRGIVPG